MILKIVEEKKRRYDELHNLMADAQVIANKAQYQSYAKEVSSLTGLVNEYNRYQKISKEME